MAQHAVCCAELHLPPDLHAGDATAAGWRRRSPPARSCSTIILDNADGKPVGSVYYRDVDNHNRSAEYGIFIGEESARGKGLGTETARLFTQFGVDTLHLHRISLRVLAENTAARRSYEKAGFVQEGVFRDMELLDGAYRDVVFMAKLAEN